MKVRHQNRRGVHLLHNANLFGCLAWRGLVKGLRRKGVLPGPRDLSDVEVVSYPKSGRTWLRLILDHLGVHLDYHHDTAEALYKPDQEFDPRGASPGRYAGRRLIFIARDPRDVVVSSYFQATRREKVWEGGLPEFLEHPKMGFPNLLHFHDHWLGIQEHLDRFKLITYEEMHGDIVRVVSEVLTFMGIEDIAAGRIRRAAGMFEFERRQASERRGILKVFYGGKLGAFDPDDPDSWKARRGKIGGFADYLDPHQVAWCAHQMQEIGSPYPI